MMNNAALKATLSQKVSAANQMHATSVSGPGTIKVSTEHSTPVSGPFSVTVSFGMPLEEVAGFIERVQAALQTHSIIKPALESAPAAASLPAQSKEQPRPASMEKLSDKQKAMILNLCRRKNLTADQMTSLLQDRFGVTDGNQLDKKRASRLIDMLMAI